MDIKTMTYWELQKLYIAIQFETLKRFWWVIAIIVIIVAIVMYRIIKRLVDGS